MKLLVTGVTGYIGGSVARKLVEKGHDVVGLVRNEESLPGLKGLGVEPLVGSLADEEKLVKAARAVDGIVNAASSDDAFLVGTLIPALKKSGKIFVQTSGSSVIADRAGGEYSDRIYHEDLIREPIVERAGRVAIDKFILGSALEGVRSIVICPTLIYGSGTGLKKDSYQVPQLIAISKRTGSGRHVGRGLNVWSHVHIDDLTELYALAIEKAQPGSFFFAENGEASMKSAAESISRLLGYGGKTEPIPMPEAIKEWGAQAAYFTFASNSRVRAEKARKLLGWSPKARGLLDDIERGSYADQELIRA